MLRAVFRGTLRGAFRGTLRHRGPYPPHLQQRGTGTGDQASEGSPGEVPGTVTVNSERLCGDVRISGDKRGDEALSGVGVDAGIALKTYGNTRRASAEACRINIADGDRQLSRKVGWPIVATIARKSRWDLPIVGLSTERELDESFLKM